MIYKINFDLTKSSDAAYVKIIAITESLQEGYVLTKNKDNADLICSILGNENVNFSFEEVPEDQEVKTG